MRYSLLLVLLLLSLSCPAQHKMHHHHKKTTVQKVTMAQMPNWYMAHGDTAVAHVYFPDYHAFYDANRQGFVFWAHNRWEFSPTVPLYLKNVDLRQSRIQVLKGLSLDLQPELNYPNYMKMYPADPNKEPIDVPVPNITNK